MFRVGIGLDSHRIRFKKGREGQTSGRNLILAGVEVSRECYALADSEGDVIVHSLCNAFSTAIGEGSLDTWAGPMFKKGITDSKEFLKVVLSKVKRKGYRVENVSIMLEGQQPKLEKYRRRMQKSLASLLGVSEDRIGLAFTTGQDLTVFGKGRGIQVISSVLIQSRQAEKSEAR